MIITMMIVAMVLGELVPKRIGLSNPEGIAKSVAGPMRFLSWLTHPIIWLLSK